MIPDLRRLGIGVGVAAGCLVAASCGKPDESLDAPETPQRPAAPPQEDAPAASEPPVPTGPSAPFPTFGVAFDPPEGWTSDTAVSKAGFLGRWVADPANPDDWRQFTVHVRPLPPDSMQSLAVASRPARALLGLGYAVTRTELDGVVADRFDAPPRDPEADPQPIPSPIFVTQHDGRAYRLIFLLNDPQAPPSGLVERVAKSWRWRPAESVATHLTLGEPRPVFDGVGTIRLPAIARSDPQLTKGGSIGFAVFDYSQGQDAIVVALELDTEPSPPELREHVVAYAERVERRTQLDRPLAFGRLAGWRDLYASDVLEGRFDQGDVTVTRLCRYAVWRPRDGTLVRLQAVVNGEVFRSEAELQAALTAVEDCLLSLSGAP